MEGSFTIVDGRIYVGTERGDLFCLNLSDGSTVWKARIGADSDSTPAVSNGLFTPPQRMVMFILFGRTTASWFGSSNHSAAWERKRNGIWASPIVAERKSLHRIEQRLSLLR